jgi:hypothetical protein
MRSWTAYVQKQHERRILVFQPPSLNCLTGSDETEALVGGKVLVRTDSAGASRKFLWHLHSLGVQFSTSYTLPLGKAHMIDWINNKEYWQPTLD